MPSLEDLLNKTSRTFALSIPVLPEPTRRQVMIAYLLFRVADTFEDAAHWEVDARRAALAEFEALLREWRPEETARHAAAWSAAGPSDHAGYGELIAETPFVLEAFFALDPEAVERIRTHVIRSAEGMAAFVSETRDGRLVLSTLEDLQRYCYFVAGIVGEMLTGLFLLKRPELAAMSECLRSRAATFGEALQLVNILKDAADDVREGRRYLPGRVPLPEVFALARKDLGIAAEYTRLLQTGGAPRGVVEFCALPAALAFATLDRVEKEGPGAKVSRLEVFRIRQGVTRALDRGEPPVFGRGIGRPG
ncbi:MAG: squalene/phytoene synthase family protein [Thermoanaerobaculia bacterium]